MSRRGAEEIRVFDVDQLVSPAKSPRGRCCRRCAITRRRASSTPGDLQLPWANADLDAKQPVVIGRLARTLGAQVPGRLVASAKSWLSHALGRSASRRSCPGARRDDVAQGLAGRGQRELSRARARGVEPALSATRRSKQQDVVLTVPASFDEGARALTLEAARIAKLPALRLLEEPQAAFYDWLFHHRETLDDELRATRGSC